MYPSCCGRCVSRCGRVRRVPRLTRARSGGRLLRFVFSLGCLFLDKYLYFQSFIILRRCETSLSNSGKIVSSSASAVVS